MKTTGNTVLVTGGGSGIGAALTEALVREGNQVIICGRRRDRLSAIKAKIPEVIFRVCDISKARSRNALVDWLLAEFGALNLLVNNAGIQRQVDFLRGTRDLQEADQEISTNLLAPMHLTARLIPHLRKKKEAGIVNISSGLAFTPLAVVPVYCATKAALHAWTLSLRYQLRNTKIRVFDIAPPIVATELSGRRRRPATDDHVMSAEAVAAGIVEALRSDEYECALGAAAYLREQREKLFSALNP
jgi:uncharacterized oxidoreductase